MHAAIVLAGGSGTRFGSTVNKAYVELDGLPLLAHSLLTLSGVVDQLVVVHRTEDGERAAAVCQDVLRTYAGTFTLVTGGDTRTGSERAGLAALGPSIIDGSITHVAVHDAARPFVTKRLVRVLFEAAEGHAGAVPCLPVESQLATSTNGLLAPLERAERLAVQTPQVFAGGRLLRAYEALPQAEGLDTAAVVLAAGETDIVVVPGDPANRKITFAADLET